MKSLTLIYIFVVGTSPITKVCLPLSAILVIVSKYWKNLIFSSPFISSEAFLRALAVATAVRAFSSSEVARILLSNTHEKRSCTLLGKVMSISCAFIILSPKVATSLQKSSSLKSVISSLHSFSFSLLKVAIF